jgi:hypothetical protein
MLKRIVFILCLAAIIPAFLASSLLAQEAKEGKMEKAAPLRIRGELIPHPDTNDVKVLTENYETLVITVDGKTRIEASVKAKLDDMAKEAEFTLPRGEVTYTVVDGKPVATRITYGSGATWNMEPPKPRED